jgi:hypothetical protein
MMKRTPIDSIYMLNLEGTNYVKIGITRDIHNRVNQIQAGVPITILILDCVRVRHARRLEAELHRHLAAFRVRGEWFVLPLDEARRTFREFTVMAAVDEAIRGNTPSLLNTSPLPLNAATDYTCKHCGAEGLTKAEQLAHGRQHARERKAAGIPVDKS